MYNSEKAATFIGWIPCNRPSASHPFPRPYEDYEVNQGLWKCKYCSREARKDLRDVHGFPPDMYDPVNYMKALGTMHGYRMIKEGEMTKVRVFRFQGDVYRQGWGKTPVDALAALYDAENP